ncbi:symporter small accessory protein [Methanococcus sp. CF]
MLGISDPYVLSAYVLCILSTLLCVVYGALNWNKGSETETDEIEEEIEWEKEEEKMEDEIGTVV